MTQTFRTLLVSNNSLETVEFELRLSNRFPLTMSDVAEKSESPRKAWRFLVDHTSYFAPITSTNWVHDPLLVLNSVGGGFCDDLASALAGMCDQSGLSSRVIGLNGHVVTEVLNNGMWQVFDSSLRVSYTDRQDNAIGVSYLEQHDCANIKINGADVVSSIIMDCNRFTPNTIHQLYRSADDNTDVTEWYLGFKKDTSTVFKLPPLASITFINNGRGSSSLLRVMVVPRSTGLLKLPFIPFAFSGAARFMVQQTAYDLTSDTVVDLDLNERTTEINMLHIVDTSYFYCFVNPRLCVMPDTTIISFSSSSTTLNAKAVAQMRPVRVVAREQAFELESLRPLHVDYLKALPEKLELTSMNDLSSEYARFLVAAPETDHAQFVNDTSQFRAQITGFTEAMNIDGHQLLPMLQNYYPNLIYELFTAAKYLKFEYMLSMLGKPEAAHHETLPDDTR